MSTQEPNHTHMLEIIDLYVWRCQEECGLPEGITNPWTVGETSEHSHAWQPSDVEGWTECADCTISIQCDHDCDHEKDTIETPYMDFNGVNYHSHTGSFCIRCGTESEPDEPDYDRDDE